MMIELQMLPWFPLVALWLGSPSTISSAWVLNRNKVTTSFINKRISSSGSNDFLKWFRTGCGLTGRRISASVADQSLSPTTSSSSPLEVRLIASDAIPTSELLVLEELISTCTPLVVADGPAVVVPLPLSDLPPGVTGRVAVMELLSDQSIDEEFLEEWQGILCQQIDEILYNEEEDCISQPILLSFADDSSTPSSCENETVLRSMIQKQISEFGLADSVETNHSNNSPSKKRNSKYIPTLWYEVDGAMVVDSDEEEEPVFDTSTVLVFDDLVSPDLRGRMLDVVLGTGSTWNDVELGPDPSRWSEGGLIDLPNDEDGASCGASTDTPISYGLTDDALEEICQEKPVPAAFEEFEKSLVNLFADFTVTRLPEAVLGPGITPLTANAPCFMQSFNDHIDADPFFAPPSPWTDIYGRYANRRRGKPRFVSCLVYLNEEWNADDWGAPTRFYDVATETAVDVSPQPGRVVIMDQDITHTVVAPTEAAGKCPRYSLVWKLILHPKEYRQNMRQLAAAGSPIYVGSAKRLEEE